MSIVITGASGQLGRLVAEEVIDRAGANGLVLVTRDPDKLSDLAARGAEVRRGDFDDAASLDAAFAGGERMLLISTDKIGARVDGHRGAIDAAARAGVGFVAYTSFLNPSDSNPVAVAPEHRATEEHLRASGLRWTMLRNSVYAEMLLPGAPAALATGQHVANDGEGRTSYVARADVAAAAAAILTSDGHDSKEYDITGPAALDVHAVAALYSVIGGSEVEAVLVDDEAYVAGLVEHAGMPEPIARAYATFGRGARENYVAVVSTSVGDLTGRSPVTAREVLEARRDELRPVSAAQL